MRAEGRVVRFLSLALAGLAALAVPCAAQQQRVERDFDVLRYPDGRQLPNVYWVSRPLMSDIGDVASSLDPLSNKCVGDVDGPLQGDGEINSDDIICSWWTARANRFTGGTFVLSRIDEATCTPVARIATISVGSTVRFTGARFTPRPDEGLQVLVSAPSSATFSPRNHAVITGDGDPAWAGHPVVFTPTCPRGAPNCCGAAAPRELLLSVPYDVAYAHSDEIACGLEGVDWADANADGSPDTCWEEADGDRVFDPGERPTGIFDGRSFLGLTRFVNVPGSAGPVSRTVTTALGRLRFTGIRFDLLPGEAYLARLSSMHQPTLWFPDLR